MKRIFTRLLSGIVIIALSGHAYAGQDTSIVVFGDTLTSGYRLQPEEGFSGKLERKLLEVGHSHFTVVNKSLPETVTADALDSAGSVLDMRPDIVVLALGYNDAARGIDPGVIYRNLIGIIRKLMSSNEPIYIVLVGVKAPAGATYSYSKQLETLYLQLADFYKLPFYPNLLEGVAGRQELNLADGVHPNAKGTDAMVENVYRLVDAGLRWKWDMNQGAEYKKQLQDYEAGVSNQPGEASVPASPGPVVNTDAQPPAAMQ